MIINNVNISSSSSSQVSLTITNKTPTIITRNLYTIHHPLRIPLNRRSRSPLTHHIGGTLRIRRRTRSTRKGCGTGMSPLRTGWGRCVAVEAGSNDCVFVVIVVVFVIVGFVGGDGWSWIGGGWMIDYGLIGFVGGCHCYLFAVCCN